MGDRLLYATPSGRRPRLGYMLSMRALELTCSTFERRLDDFRFSLGPVQMARCAVAGASIDQGFDYLVMHDDDMMVSCKGGLGNPIDRWHEMMQADPTIGMIGAVYLAEHSQLPQVVLEHPDYPEAPGVHGEMCHAVHGFTDGPKIVSGVGTGFVMIRVSALKALREAELAIGAPPLFKFALKKTRWGTAVEVGEDYDFCQRLRGVGYQIVADPRFDTTHLKDTGDLTFNREAWEEQFTGPNAQREWDRIGSVLQPGCKVRQISGLVCIDHSEARKADAEAWRAKLDAQSAPGKAA